MRTRKRMEPDLINRARAQLTHMVHENRKLNDYDYICNLLCRNSRIKKYLGAGQLCDRQHHFVRSLAALRPVDVRVSDADENDAG